MANEFKVKNGLIVNSTQKLVSPNLSQAITLRMLDSGTLSFSGTSGQLFSITDSLTGTIFAVNDISGVPSIEVFDTGKIQLAETFGNVLIGSNSDDGSNKLQVIGNTKVTGNINVTGSIKGPVGPTGLFGQIYFGAVDHQWGGLQISDSHGEMLRLRSNQNPLGPLIRDTFWYSWMSNDVGISRDAANTLAQRNSTNPQTFRVYNTFTDASNYERAKIGWNGNIFEIKSEAAGTGSARNISIHPSSYVMFQQPSGGSQIYVTPGTGTISSNIDLILKSGSDATVRFSTSSALVSALTSFDFATSWNNSEKTFTGLKLNVTDTASSASSNLLDLQVGGTSKFRVDKTGNAYIGSNPVVVGPTSSTDDAIVRFDGTTGKLVQNSPAVLSDNGILTLYPSGDYTGSAITLRHTNGNSGSLTKADQNIYIHNGYIGIGIGLIARNDTYIGFSNSQWPWGNYGTLLYQDSVFNLAQRNSTNPQTFRVYNTFTDASNYERAKIGWNSNTLEIGTEAAGTGTLRNINLIGGNVGIGTSTPSYKFDIRDNVNGNLFINIANTNSGGGGSGYGSGIRFMGAVSNIGPKASGRIYSDFSANAYQYSRIVFQTANGDDSFENALVVQGGKVAIGASTADYKLDVAGSLATGSIGVENILKLYRPLNPGPSYPQIASFAIGRYSTDAAPYAQTRLDILLNELTGSKLLTVMTLQANGNIGIGTTSPSAKLDVVGDIEINSSVRLNSETTTLTTITQTQIAAFAKATYSSGKFIIQTKDTVTNEVQISELLVVHDETTASATEYGIVYTGLAKLATYNVDISGDNVRILATSSSTNSTTYKISETLITA